MVIEKMKYRPDIDGLRAVAVGAVLLSHAFPTYLPGGFIGVDIFFVISGYLISLILIREIETSRFSILTFYRRRILRIFPALFVVLAATLLIGWYTLFRNEFIALGKHVAASVLFAENLLLWSEVSYFDASSDLKPTLHLWSLAIEEQFYIVWPLIMYLCFQLRMNALWAIALLGGASFLINLRDLNTDPTAAYYSPLGRAWELMIGSLLAYLQSYHQNFLARHQKLQSLIGTALIAFALIVMNEEKSFPGFWALLPTFGAFFLISAGPTEIINRTVLSRGVMIWIGLISYPLYLWHWVFLSYGHIWFGTMTVKKAAVALLVSVIAAQLTYSLVEKPLRHRKSTGPIIGLVSAIFLVFVVSGSISYQMFPARLDAVKQPTRNEWTQILEDESFSADVREFAFFYPLHADRPKQVLLIGDSHIAQYTERLDQAMMQQSDYPGALLAIGGGCIPIPGVKTDDPRRRVCSSMIEDAYDKAEDVIYNRIIIGGAWSHYFIVPGYYIETSAGRIPLTSEEGRIVALRQLGEAIDTLESQGKEVVFVLDNFIDEKFIQIGTHIRLSPSSTRDLDLSSTRIAPSAAQIDNYRIVKRWVTEEGFAFIDPAAEVCVEFQCRIQSSDGTPIYRDAGHFNPDWSRWNAKFIDEVLQ